MPSVYLLHFERSIGNPNSPLGQARHYIGYAKSLKKRLAQHTAGNGSAIMAFLSSQGIGFCLARTWSNGSRKLERQIKNSKHASRYCPICSGEKEYKSYEPNPSR